MSKWNGDYTKGAHQESNKKKNPENMYSYVSRYMYFENFAKKHRKKDIFLCCCMFHVHKSTKAFV